MPIDTVIITGEKGHFTNDCHQLKKQIEATLESGKLDHLIRNVRQQGRDAQKDNHRGKKVINMIGSVGSVKRKAKEQEEPWMQVPLTFPPVSSEDLSEEPLVVEAEV